MGARNAEAPIPNKGQMDSSGQLIKFNLTKQTGFFVSLPSNDRYGGRKMATSGRADETLSQADWRHSEQRHSTRPCLSHRRQEGKPTEPSLFCGLAPNRMADLRASEQSPMANIARMGPFYHLKRALRWFRDQAPRDRTISVD